MELKTVKELPASILEGIKAGHIRHAIEKVEISAKSSPTNKDEAQDFDALYALDAEGMALLCGGKIEPQTEKPEDGKDERTEEQKRLGACDHFNYGRILSVRQQVRAALSSRLEGPEKTIEKAVKAGIAAGLYDNETEARAEVVGALVKRGKLPEGYGQTAPSV